MTPELIPSLKPSYDLLKKAIQNEVVFVTGPPSTGKTTIVKKVFNEDFVDVYLSAYVDCYSIPSQAKLFSTIYQAYSSTLNLSKTRAHKTKTRLPDSSGPANLADFPRLLNEYHDIAKEKGYRGLFIVLDHVDVFEKTNLMDSFVALCRAVTQNLISLRLVVVSYEDPSDIVHYITQKSVAIGLSFQDRMQVVSCSVWSREDTVDWIMSLPPKLDELHDLYAKFVRNIVTLVYTSDSRDPRQIRMYCQQNFADFLDYHRNKTKEQIKKILKLGTDETIEDEVVEEYTLGVHHNTALVQSFLNNQNSLSDKKRSDFRWTHENSEVKMTINTATMIVASYLAAYTRPADDKWNFVRYQARKAKSRDTTSNNVNKPFTLERLVQIYIQLLQKSVGERKLHIIYNNDCALADVERLENLNILQHQGGYELSSEARYKLSPSIKRAYVERLAQHNNLSLEWFRGVATD